MELESLVAQQNERIAQLTEMLAGFLMQKECLPLHNNEENKKMPYLKEGTLFKRKNDGRWEAKLVIDGKQKTIACCKRQEDAYKKLKEAINEKNRTQKKKDTKSYTLFSWIDHWHAVYRMPKKGKELSNNTIIMDLSMIRKIKQVFKDVKLKDLTADYIQQKLYSMTQGRTCEGVYTILKLALEKAKDVVGRNIMEQVEKVKHERKKGKALSKEEITKLLDVAANDMERNVIKFYIYTGCRVDEISATKVKYINLTNENRIITNLNDLYGKSVPDMTLRPNEILIHGTKTKGSIRTMPIMPPLKPILEELIKDRGGEERLFPYTTVMIRKFHKLIKEKSKVSFTLKDYRHTAATNFKDAGIPSSVYFRWFGWSDDTMARKVYTHETDYEKNLSQEWAEKFVSPR